jgi:hypothetical protein
MTLLACAPGGTVAVLKPEGRFALAYGSFENEIKLFDTRGEGLRNTHVVMREGLFYVTNGESQKVIQLNSYGDLLTFFYNKDTNPAPTFGAAPEGERVGGAALQRAVAYPFINPGFTAVDERKFLYVVDQVPPEQQERDTVNRLLLSQVVLRFATDGTFVDYVGQQGPGGTPFPYVKDLYVTKNNELVVVCQATSGMIVYWYSPEGLLLFTVPVNYADLPNHRDGAPGTTTAGAGGETYRSLKKIVPHREERLLYLLVDYYRNALDPTTLTQFGTEYAGSVLHCFDVVTGDFTGEVPVPSYEEVVTENRREVPFRLSYDLLGLSDRGYFFFTLADERGYMLQVISADGSRIFKRRLDLDPQGLVYTTFDLSPEGIISALLGGEKTASLVWWRSDALLASPGS